MVRNDLIFRGVQPNLILVKDHFKLEFASVVRREKRALQS
jgi:hypothetical protein